MNGSKRGSASFSNSPFLMPAVCGQEPVHRPGDAFVKEDLHSTAASNADSERSSIRRAMASVTVGKNSVNCSSV